MLNPRLTGLILFFLSCLFFGYRLNQPGHLVYDEVYYVPAATQFAQPDGKSLAVNLEHPPLAKLIISVGITLFGRNPIGWRIMSVLFGALLIVVLYNWGLRLFKSQKWALVLVLLTLCNQVLYVQSRIAMLDTFMAVLVLVSAYLFYVGTHDETWNKKYVAAAAFVLGLAAACKLSAVTVGFIYAIWFLKRIIRKRDFDGSVFILLLCMPLLGYFLSYVPYTFYPQFHISLADIWPQQLDMWNFHKTLALKHSYQSEWSSWALMIRPMWYSYEKFPALGEFSGIIMLGNPFLMWTGYAAFIYLIYEGFINKSRDLVYVLLVFAVLYFSWAVIPRKINFIYYYYPAALVLPFFPVYLMQRLEGSKWNWVSVLYISLTVIVFVFFFPIISALDEPIRRFDQWIWLKSWI